MARHNWSKMRAEYVTGSASQRELAKKYGVSASQVAEHASNEGWAKKRREYRRKTEAKAVQKAQERKAETMAAQLSDIGTAAENLSALIAEVSTEAKSLRVGRSKKADTKAIRNLTGALKDLADVLRNVYELPTFGEKQKMDRASGPAVVRVEFDEDEEEDDGANGGDQAAQAPPEAAAISAV